MLLVQQLKIQKVQELLNFVLWYKSTTCSWINIFVGIGTTFQSTKLDLWDKFTSSFGCYRLGRTCEQWMSCSFSCLFWYLFLITQNAWVFKSLQHKPQAPHFALWSRSRKQEEAPSQFCVVPVSISDHSHTYRHFS